MHEQASAALHAEWTPTSALASGHQGAVGERLLRRSEQTNKRAHTEILCKVALCVSGEGLSRAKVGKLYLVQAVHGVHRHQDVHIRAVARPGVCTGPEVGLATAIRTHLRVGPACGGELL